VVELKELLELVSELEIISKKKKRRQKRMMRKMRLGVTGEGRRSTCAGQLGIF